MTVQKRYHPRGSAAMTGAHQWEANAAVKSGGRNHVWEERQITRKYIQQKGGDHCDGYRIGDSRHTGGKPAPVCAKKPYRLEVLEMRPDRRKGRNLSAQLKAKAPPLYIGESGLLHTKCVSISVKPLRTHCMTKFSIWFKMRPRQELRSVIQWAYRKRASRLKGVRYEREAVGVRQDHSVV